MPQRAEQAMSEDAAWSAVLARDRARDGAFVYAVRTTGVYCRPSCPSRRPRRENVSFFATAAGAEQAGYRACARCGPGAGRDAARQAVERAVAILEARPDRRVALGELARLVGMSPFHLQRTFRRTLGVSPRAFQDALRLARFKSRVRQGEPVGLATYEAGYGSSRGLYESARAGLGMTPAAYRRGGQGERIRFATVPSDLGPLLVAATARGVCAVSLGADDAALEKGLRAEFPRAEVARDDAGVRPWVRAVVRRIEGAPAPLRLDLHRVPAPGLGRAPRHPLRRDPLLRAGGGGHRRARRLSRRGARLRGQPARPGGPMPPGGPRGRRPGRLPLGSLPQAQDPRPRAAAVMNYAPPCGTPAAHT
jgi:AraC family transcriptional regulator, regulatory protein of adaptative response / methylated-DNA-[protein]-cysteine methyltransferase